MVGTPPEGTRRRRGLARVLMKTNQNQFIEALIPNGSDPPFGEDVPVWTPARQRHALHMCCRSIVLEPSAELRISIVPNVTAGIRITRVLQRGVPPYLLHPILVRSTGVI